MFVCLGTYVEGFLGTCARKRFGKLYWKEIQELVSEVANRFPVLWCLPLKCCSPFQVVLRWIPSASTCVQANASCSASNYSALFRLAFRNVAFTCRLSLWLGNCQLINFLSSILPFIVNFLQFTQELRQQRSLSKIYDFRSDKANMQQAMFYKVVSSLQ